MPKMNDDREVYLGMFARFHCRDEQFNIGLPPFFKDPFVKRSLEAFEASN
jgi:hypothetical protein